MSIEATTFPASADLDLREIFFSVKVNRDNLYKRETILSQAVSRSRKKFLCYVISVKQIFYCCVAPKQINHVWPKVPAFFGGEKLH